MVRRRQIAWLPRCIRLGAQWRNRVRTAVSDAAAAGLTQSVPLMGLAPGTATGQTSIDGAGLLFLLGSLVQLSEGRNAPALAFNAQIASQNAGSGQAFASPSGSLASNETAPNVSLLASRLGDLLSQSARLYGGLDARATGYQPLSQSAGQLQQPGPPAGLPSQSLPVTAQSASPQSGAPLAAVSAGPLTVQAWVWPAAQGNAGQSAGDGSSATSLPAPPGQALSLPQPTAAQAAQGQPLAQSATQPATPQAAFSPAPGDAQTAGSNPLPATPQAAFPVQAGITEMFLSAPWVIAYGAGTGQAVQRAHDDAPAHGRTKTRKQGTGGCGESGDTVLDGSSIMTLGLPNGIHPIADLSGLTIGVRDLLGRGLVLAVRQDGRIMGLALRLPCQKTNGGLQLFAERQFDLRMLPLGERRIELPLPVAHPNEPPEALFHFEWLMPITDSAGLLRAFADAGLRRQKAGLTIAPVIKAMPDEGPFELKGFSMIIAKQSAHGPECVWRSYDLEGRPLTNASDHAAVE